jgi:hypothetical protein
MACHALAIFRAYLESLPEDLLTTVTADYVWLAEAFRDDGERGADFGMRRECCRQECIRRGVPWLYDVAEGDVHAA